MSDPIEFTTFYNPDYPGLLIINQGTLETLIELLEVNDVPVTWNNDLSPDHGLDGDSEEE